MKLKKGDRFKDYMGKLCFISYMRLDIIKLTFIGEESYVEVWDKEEFINEVKGNRFFPQPKVTVNRNNITEHLIEYQLNMVGKTVEDAKNDPTWYSNNTFTSKQAELFKSYAIPLLRKIFKFNKKKAEQSFAWFDLGYGLKVKD